MPLSAIDAAKLQKYQARHQASSKSNFNPINRPDNPEPLPDLISWCVEDIARQMKENNREIAQKSDLEMEEIKTKIAIKIFNEALNLAASDQIEIDSELKNELMEAESSEELIFKIAIYNQTFPEFGYKLTIYALTTYMAMCIKYKMQPNQEIKSIYQFFLEN